MLSKPFAHYRHLRGKFEPRDSDDYGVHPTLPFFLDSGAKL